MTKLAKIELLVPLIRRRSGGPDPGSLERAVEDLLIFDSRFLDKDTRHELQRLLPALIHASRFWIARFAEKGCLCCRRKKVPYGAGGLCDRCHARESRGIREWNSKRFADRDFEKEASALSRRLDLAQALFNGGEE
jgi:hypothetical protein